MVSLDDNEGLRVQYLLKNITKEELGNDVMKRDKRKRKLIEMMHLYELIAAVGNDLINHIHTFVYNNLKTEDNYFVICREMTEKFTEFDKFVDYVNQQFKLISVTYSQNVIQIEKNDYTQHTMKFKVSDIETFS